MLTTTPDHVAAIVPDIDASLTRWSEVLGGVHQWDFHNPGRFRGTVVTFAGGVNLELLMPSDEGSTLSSTGGPTGFVEAFLERFGPRVHHVTLKVPDLLEAVDQLAAAGIEAVDVDTSDDGWHEAFVPPSIVGGCIVQVARQRGTNADWAAENGHELLPAPAEGPVLRGPALTVADLDRAREVWTILGADVDEVDADSFRAHWATSPLDVVVRRGPRNDAPGLRFAGAGPRPVDPVLGPAVLPG